MNRSAAQKLSHSLSLGAGGGAAAGLARTAGGARLADGEAAEGAAEGAGAAFLANALGALGLAGLAGLNAGAAPGGWAKWKTDTASTSRCA